MITVTGMADVRKFTHHGNSTNEAASDLESYESEPSDEQDDGEENQVIVLE